jgi:nuclear pore complex protein Nup62
MEDTNRSIANSLFGNTATTGAGSLFGATPSKAGSNTDAFKFNTSSTNAFGSVGASKTPAFGATNGSTTGFNFNSSSTADKKDDKPAFSFGGLGNTAATTSSPAVSFGQKVDAAKPGLSFGSTSNTEQSKPTLNFSLGGASSTSSSAGGLFGAPAAKTDGKQTASSFSFSAPKADDKPAAPGLSFSAPKADGKPTAPFTFGGASTGSAKPDTKAFSLGGTPAEKVDKLAAPMFALGGVAPAKKDEKPAAPSFSLGAATANKEDKAATPASSLGGFAGKKDDKPAALSFNLGTKTDDKKATTTPGFSLSASKIDEKKYDDREKKTVSFTNSVISRDEKKETAKTVEPQPVSLNNKTLEDLITKWTNQLTKASGSFQSYSEKIKEWDAVLVEGGDKISQLYNDVVAAEQSQSKIEQQLLYVERQQSELEIFLDNYEAKAENLLSEVLSSNNQQRDSSVITNDQKREQAYRTAELLDENLNSLGLNLSSLITEINDVSDSFNKANGLGKEGSSEEEESSLNQIVKLLNAHFDSLKHIEKNADELKSKLDHFKNVDI